MHKAKKQLLDFVQHKIEDCKVMIVGDVMLDKYYYGEVKRISPEAPVPITRVLKEKETLGGAANVAHNLALLGCKTYLLGSVGDDIHRQSLEKKLTSLGVNFAGLICTPGPTTTKLRIIGGHQQMMRLDFEETTPIHPKFEEEILQQIIMRISQGVKAIIISDYGKGFCTVNLCNKIIALAQEHAVLVVVDPKGTDWSKYNGCDYITPNLKELQETLNDEIANEDLAVTNAAKMVRKKNRIKNIMVTRSEQGVSLIGNRLEVHIPTLAQEVFDVSGAGDTVIAVLALALAGGVEPKNAAYLANLAASVVVAKLGTYAISNKELVEVLKK